MFVRLLVMRDVKRSHLNVLNLITHHADEATVDKHEFAYRISSLLMRLSLNICNHTKKQRGLKITSL